jgi:hypothetical protein
VQQRQSVACRLRALRFHSFLVGYTGPLLGSLPVQQNVVMFCTVLVENFHLVFLCEFNTLIEGGGGGIRNPTSDDIIVDLVYLPRYYLKLQKDSVDVAQTP